MYYGIPAHLQAHFIFATQNAIAQKNKKSLQTNTPRHRTAHRQSKTEKRNNEPLTSPK
jgi:hypothetical protein